MTAPAFEEVPMPKPDIRVDAFGEITATERRPFVMGDFYTADQLRAYGDQRANAALEEAAKAVEQHDRTGREWIPTSLWGTLSNEAAARIRALMKGARK
ncbi:hypothetical protein [Variovorax sp.]|uniref:hypothetical protein n=1 Tax=Variovorax sp. TaxID=1871043 RepID=UPI001382CCF0|nr:hypothetical protein [Variovorax sp.]KAF1071997.1 MAG: hypothetical protein GAK39_00908 [Variovorax sp.]